MARIENFEQLPNQLGKIHKPVDCGFKVFAAQGQTILQLETYGSVDRQQRGTISQSIQLDEAAAAQLIDIVRRAFPHLK